MELSAERHAQGIAALGALRRSGLSERLRGAPVAASVELQQGDVRATDLRVLMLLGRTAAKRAVCE